MTPRHARRAPADLGAISALDPYAIEPGTIIHERFCALGHVRHRSQAWQVAVTDLARELGPPPHHRIDLFVLSEVANEALARRALRAHEPLVQACMKMGENLGLFVSRMEGSNSPHPDPEERPTLFRYLIGLVERLHRLGISHLRIRPDQIRISGTGQLHFVDWTHLHALGPLRGDGERQADLQALKSLLLHFGAPEGMFSTSFTTASELLHRIEHADAPTGILPLVPPFIGREPILSEVRRALQDATREIPVGLLVRGDRGMGKTRLLEELWQEHHPVDSVLVVRLEHIPNSERVHGLGSLLDALAQRLEELPRTVREPIGRQLSQQLDAFPELLRELNPRLASLIAPGSPLVPLPLIERFVRYAAVVAQAIAAVGTPQRPLLLLIDDVDHAETSIGAMLYQLLHACAPHPTVVVMTATTDATIGHRRLELDAWAQPQLEQLIHRVFDGTITNRTRLANLMLASGCTTPQGAWDTVQHWVSHEGLTYQNGRWNVLNLTDIPPTFAPIFPTLSTGAQTLVASLAIRGFAVTQDLLGDVHKFDRKQMETTLHELAERGLILIENDSLVSIASAPLRQRILAEAPIRVRQMVHQQIASWFHAWQDASAVSAEAWHQHLAVPSLQGKAQGELHLRAGLQQLRRFDANRALWHFERSLRCPISEAHRRASLEGIGDARLLLREPLAALTAYNANLSLTSGRRRRHAGVQFAHRMLGEATLQPPGIQQLVLTNQALRPANRRVPRTFLEGSLRLTSLIWDAIRLDRGQPMADQVCRLHLAIANMSSLPRPARWLSALKAWANGVGRRTGWAAAGRSALAMGLLADGHRGPHQPAPWLSRFMLGHLERCERAARKSQHDPALGIVLHYRAELLFRTGEYDAAKRAVTRAVETFHRVGDLAMGLRTLQLAIGYGWDREPVPELAMLLDSMETVALRQHRPGLMPGIMGARLMLQARAGEVDIDEALEVGAELMTGPVEPVGEIWGAAMVALALLHLDHALDAIPYAERALLRLDAQSTVPPFLEVALVAATRVAVARQPHGNSAEANRLLRRLQRRQQPGSAIRFSAQLTQAQYYVKRSQFRKAEQVYRAVISEGPSHGHRWSVLEAQHALADLIAGQNPVQASALLSLAEALSQRLIPPHEPVAPSTSPRIRLPVIDPGPQDTSIAPAFRDLQNVLARHLGERELNCRVAPDLRTPVPEDVVQLLLVNLILAANDAATGPEPVELVIEGLDHGPFGQEPGAHVLWNRIRVRVDCERRKGPHSGLAECRELCETYEGWLDVSRTSAVDFAVWLPRIASLNGPDRGLVLVSVESEGVERTLIDGLRGLGFAAQAMAGDEPEEDSNFVGLFTDHSLRFDPGPAWVCRVVPRQPGFNAGEDLPIPFLIRELEDLVTERERQGTPSS